MCNFLLECQFSEHVYGDEQSAFDCNTKETGCPNACYSGEMFLINYDLLIAAFAPISQIRFWGAQVICVATPSAFFVVYSIERKPTGNFVWLFNYYFSSRRVESKKKRVPLGIVLRLQPFQNDVPHMPSSTWLLHSRITTLFERQAAGNIDSWKPTFARLWCDSLSNCFSCTFSTVSMAQELFDISSSNSKSLLKHR